MDGEPATIERDGAIRSGHKGSHMTAPMQRIEVITRSERRRRWSIEEKREIVAESLGSGVRPSEIIQRHGITSGQLYAWRQQLTRRVDGQPVRLAAKFARVDVVAAEQASQAEPPASPPSKPQTHVPAIAAPRAKGLIEILLPDGTSVRVDGQVDERALRCVLDALQTR
jgi:transposase